MPFPSRMPLKRCVAIASVAVAPLLAPALVLALWCVAPARAAQPPAAGSEPSSPTVAALASPAPAPGPTPDRTLRLPTLGGPIWWIDVWEQDGYRIQTHKIFGWRRLLDPANALLAMGDFDDCQEALARALATAPEDQAINWNLPAPTLGGVQFWGDELYQQGWKIQKNALTGHYRLLDPDQTRRAWGTWTQCLRELGRLAPPPPANGAARPVVFLIHGILLGPWSFDDMADRLVAEGYAVCSVAYPSTQASIADHAAQLNRLLERLEGCEELYLVGHSMGGLIARQALADRPDPRVRRMVTLGTPHTGAVPADLLQDWYPYQIVFGPAGQQLISGAKAIGARLPPPPVPMGCVAGGRGDDQGYNPLLPGDNDGTVTVDSALYAGATDTLVVPTLHSFLMGSERVIANTIAFLRDGAFLDE